MKTIYYLTMMQLKDKLDMSGKSLKINIFKGIISLIKFVALVAVLFLAFYVLGFFRWVSLDGQIPLEVLVVLVSLLFAFTIVACTIKIMDSLYFGKDNTFLLTIPATKTQLFISKLVLIYLYELIKNINYILPLFIAYGMVNAYPIGYYFWLIPCLIIFTLLIVAISGLLSIPSMQVNILLKKHLWLKTIVVAVLLVAVILSIIKLISILPENFNFVETWSTTYWEIQDFLALYKSKMIPFVILCEFAVGLKVGSVVTLFSVKTLINLSFIALFIAIVLTITILLVRPLFFKMASVPFEYKKNDKITNKQNYQLPPFMSFLKKEILVILRTPSKINSLIMVSILCPLSIFLMNKIYMAMDVRAFGFYMIIAFNVLMITLFATSSNASIATSLSEEGQAFYLTKINPNKYIKFLLPKILFNAYVMSISILVSVIIFMNFTSLPVGQGVLIYFIIELVYLSHALWSAELDIMNPQYSQYATVGSMITNPNEVKSTLLAFAISIILALFVFVNLTENTLNFYNVWIKLLIVAVLLFALRIYMYKNQIELYYKEK